MLLWQRLTSKPALSGAVALVLVLSIASLTSEVGLTETVAVGEDERNVTSVTGDIRFHKTAAFGKAPIFLSVETPDVPPVEQGHVNLPPSIRGLQVMHHHKLSVMKVFAFRAQTQF